MTVQEYAEKHHVTPETVRKWCRDGRLPGARQDGPGKPWIIPDYALPPRQRRYSHPNIIY